MLLLRGIWRESGIWRWQQTLKKDYVTKTSALPNSDEPGLQNNSAGVSKFFELFTTLGLSDLRFFILLWLRLLILIFLSITPWVAATSDLWRLGIHSDLFLFMLFSFILYSSILIKLHFRGVFNGGSDYMSFILQMACWISLLGKVLALFTSINSQSIMTGALLYLGLQSIWSYVVAGYIKLIRVNWRNGHALPSLMKYSLRPSGRHLGFYLEKNLFVCKLLTWGFILMELAFPFILLQPKLALLLFPAGIVFHFLNYWLLGLNRFAHIWPITYWAILFTARFIHGHYFQ
jgi:hypothetical protein